MRLAAKARRQQDTPVAAVKGPFPEVTLLTASKTLFHRGESDADWDQYTCRSYQPHQNSRDEAILVAQHDYDVAKLNVECL